LILTIDFGTSVTKVALWTEDGLVALARAQLATARPEVGWAEQDPFGWWTAVVVACADARAAAPAAFGSVDVVSCSAARQTFVPLTSAAEPLGKGLLWSDRRAVVEAGELAASLGGDEEVRRRTGVPLDGGAVAAKIAWVAEHQPGRLAACDWLLSPRDVVVWRLTGEVLTDVTLASRTGLYDTNGELVPELAGPAAAKLPPVVPSDHVAGGLRAVPAAELGLRPGIPVVIGAGDRQCEVLGAGASLERPMVSWGTTANVSVPTGGDRPDPPPAGAVLSRAADGGWMLEGGLSAAGSFLAWLGRVAGKDPDELARLAAASPPGARGVVAVPWLDGARAPWWRDDARAAFVGLASAHDAGDLARAVLESVAWEVDRCLVAVTSGRPGGPPAVGLTLGGAGTGVPLWVDVLTSVTALPATRRRSGEAASAGAALLGAAAVGHELTLDTIDPVVSEMAPDPAGVELYRGMRPAADRVAGAVLELGLGTA
jgi:xylulokinase